MDQEQEVWKLFSQQQEKYVYFLISIAVASIGFSVAITKAASFEKSQIFLGLAVVSWGVSIFIGLKRVRVALEILFDNISFLKIQKQQHELGLMRDPEVAQVISKFRAKLNKTSDVSSSLFKWQGVTFYVGIILFVIWHLLNMYSNTVK